MRRGFLLAPHLTVMLGYAPSQWTFEHESGGTDFDLVISAQGRDATAARQLWDTYFLRMVEVARLKLHGTRARMADEEDVALSAFKSFCRGTCDGRFPQFPEHEDPWPLLLALTNHKAIDLVRYERRVKRGGPGLASRRPDSPESRPGR